jgi:hypothetical protein
MSNHDSHDAGHGSSDHHDENKAKNENIAGNSDINFFASTNFRNSNRKFGIKLDDRRRHMYVVGKTGMGKTTLLENMVLNDIYAGHGVGVVDPHGDFAEKIIDYIPPHRINDVVYFNPADMEFPIGFNILETIDPRYRHLVAAGLMGVFKKIWPDVWSSRMEYILNNTLLALIEYPNTTLLGINRLLADETYRKRVVRNLKDPVIRSFWETEFAGYNDRYKQEAVAPLQNKIGQFLSASVIRNIVAQVRSRINIREIMDTRKIFIMNLSKGRIGEDNSRLLGGMLITKIQLAAMERVDTAEKDRKDFFLYVDEFQNFATESFSNILSEARKYRLDLIMAHQYMEQLDENVLAAVIGNVGTLVTFRVGSTDAEILAKEFAPTFVETDLVNLTKFQIYLKLMIDGVASQPFSANTLSPINLSTGSFDKVVRVSRERYATNRANIEDKIIRWTGMDAGGAGGPDDEGEIDDGAEDAGAAPEKKVKKDDDEEYTEDEEGMPVKIFTPEKKPVQDKQNQNNPKPSGDKNKKPAEKTPGQQPQPAQKKPEERRGQQSAPKPSGDKNKSNQHYNNQNQKKKLDIGQSSPILLVDTDQKGISLSQAMHTNKQAVKKELSDKSGTEISSAAVSEPQIMPAKSEEIMVQKQEIQPDVTKEPSSHQASDLKGYDPVRPSNKAASSPQAGVVSGKIPPHTLVKID